MSQELSPEMSPETSPETSPDTGTDAGPEIVPGEMRLWSDRGSSLRPAAGGPAVLALLESVADPGSTLLVGPHGDDVIAALAGGSESVTVVVRSLSDAEQIAATHPVSVVCGDFTRFAESAGGRRWDRVIALDGLERVASNDWPSPPWAERFALLEDLVAEGGRLVLAVDNPTSAVALADARPLAERRETGDWEPPAGLDPTRPRTLADLPAGTVYAGAWMPSAPGVLVSPDRAADLRVRSALGRDLASLGDRELLLDPMPHVSAQIDAGRFADVATSWVVVTGPVPDYEPFPGEPPEGELVVDRVVALAQAEDLVALRGLVRSYLPGATAFADATIAGGPALVPGEATPTSAAHWLARRLLAPDVRKIWPRWVGTEELARSLAAMAGIVLDEGPVTLPPLPVLEEDLRSLRAVNETLRGELSALRGELFAQRRLIENRDRQLERRSNRLHEAELRAARAEALAQAHSRSLLRRALRAVRHPRRALAAVRRRLSSR